MTTTLATLSRDRARAMGYELERLSDRRVYVVSQPSPELALKAHGGYDSYEDALADIAVKWLRRYRETRWG